MTHHSKVRRQVCVHDDHIYLFHIHNTTVMPVLKDTGCYVNADNDHAFLFGAEQYLTCISGYEAYTQALVGVVYIPRIMLNVPVLDET